MFWLMTHMWLLLLLSFLLGLMIGWWIWSRKSETTVAAALSPVPETAGHQGNDAPERGETGTMPTLYNAPSEGPADDLKKISGIGPAYEKVLNETGVYYYRQIAGWSEDEVLWMDTKLDFPGRIAREKWQEQAVKLDQGGETEFARRYSQGETPSSYMAGSVARAGDRLLTGADYIDDVRRYDPAASLDIVNRIVAFCGDSLKTRDGALVACSDKKEREGIRDHYCTKRLKLIPPDADKAIENVCQQMKADRNKSTVTFYYLLARSTGTLDTL